MRKRDEDVRGSERGEAQRALRHDSEGGDVGDGEEDVYREAAYRWYAPIGIACAVILFNASSMPVRRAPARSRKRNMPPHNF